VRHRLVPVLVMLGRDEAAAAILDRFPDDCSAAGSYNRALTTFRLQGDSAEARRHLRTAIESNRHVSEQLLNLQPLHPHLADDADPGTADEAARYVVTAIESWESTGGALTWLLEFLGQLGS
jgi:hypothetical protein